MKIEVIHLEVAEQEEQEEEMEEVEEDSTMEESSLMKKAHHSQSEYFAAEQKNNVWFLDSGCTNHMTGNKNIFLDMDTTINSQVKMGNGDLVNVKGKGTVDIQTKVGTKYIRDVLLVPALEQNLLSVGQLVEHGMEDVEEAWLWHKRFGHLNFNSLKILCQRKMVQGLPNTIEEKNEVCDGCALGKHHRQLFPKGVAWRAKKQKSEVFSIFKKFKSFVEKQSGCYIKTLRSDRGMEYTSSQFGNFCEDEGVERQLTVAYTPQQNGVVERKNQTMPTKALLNKTPIEAWSGRKPSVRHFKFTSKGYRLYNLKTNKLIISRDVIFDEKAAWNWEEGKILKKTILVDELQTKTPTETGNGSTSTSSPQDSPRSVPLSPSTESPTSSSSSPSSTPIKMRSLSDVYERCNLCIFEPQSFEEAIKDEDWRKAMEKEIDVIEKNETWQLIEKPKDKEIIGVKWIYRVKHHSDGRVQRLKARLVAKGYSQQPGVDFHETFAPIARLDTIRTIIAVAAKKGFVVDGEENKVYKLKKALYGLKQAPRAGTLKLTTTSLKMVSLEAKSIKKKMVCLFAKRVEKEDGGKMVDETHFRSLVGNMLYLTATRPDIMFAASLLSRFMHYPSHLHLGAAKRVLRYLQGMVELGIKYFRNIEVKLIGHCDSDWGGCIDDMKSTSGYAFSLGSVLYLGSQKSKLRRILEDIKEKQNEATYLLCDNKSAIAIAKNYVFHSRTRHIAVKYHFIKEAISDGEVQLMYYKSEEQVADIFTKALPLEKLVHFRKLLGVEKHHIRGRM
ncbi:Retrovirus-related Pol polyprotein from transposon TNT 1-94 [Vitis vinifera]|uniref:Retrovirus-related Pol polyprotein from transposon TNT 1-94 n=1 Tax=Vitis vinifera TaxID=29760 RepID=A0A438HJF5_VITVI|nr:Retrovirus-related Pol polyprotein from transposon TNT 1-94 [Vitis vinifera]